jgi:hypothetical protein
MRNAYRLLAAIPAVALLGFSAHGALQPVATNPDRPDCPGQITCPLTGQLVCRDQCPLLDAGRTDCPGRVICAQTGQLVCSDLCPLGRSAARPASDGAKGSCCAACKK